MFSSILITTTIGNVAMQSVMICTVVSILMGLVISGIYMLQGGKSKNFSISLVLLPVIIQVVIMMVNGNLGTGVAVAGAFSLVRFRSVPGTSKEICCIFFAMAIGLATGMGFVVFAALMTIIIGALLLVLSKTKFGELKDNNKVLKITIPENLDYAGIFDDLFEQFTTRSDLERVKTVNLGSMYELNYNITLKDAKQEKAFIDEIRCRNGNLIIVCARPHDSREQL